MVLRRDDHAAVLQILVLLALAEEAQGNREVALAHLARAVQSYLWNQVDGATACPTGMAYAGIPFLRDTPELSAYADRVAQSG